MKTMTVGEFKTHFSEVIEQVKKGEEIAVTYGKKKEIIGYFKPKVKALKRERSVGLFDKMEGYFMADNFCETTEEEFPINDLPL
ncbi:type II toxin-antitoxin system Phd/YefM family antitoxin [Flavobacterium sp.]|uniref:type II toxin-antitoxin system Phd/YefM family antitoxin n=1 Tax=Flavobacterium sp. TaxID=239 RepID=UPI00375035B4